MRALYLGQRFVVALGFVLVVAGFVAYRAGSKLAVFDPVISSTPQTMFVNPALQDVFRYLRAHRSNQPSLEPTATVDPAQRSVLDYLHAHERIDQAPTLWEQTVQAVHDYLRTHS